MKKIYLIIVFIHFLALTSCGEERDEPKNLENDLVGVIGSYKFTTYQTLQMALSQAMAVYGDYIILFSYNSRNATAYLYKLSDGKLITILSLPNSTYKRPHCNSASFSNVFNSANSIFPLLYVSQWDNDSEKGCFVFDITLNNGSYKVDLVQTILPTNVDTAIRGAGQIDWVVDPYGYIYSIGYLLNNGAHSLANNKTMVVKYKLTTINDGSLVILGDANVLDHFEIPIFIYRQDLCFYNGRILMLTGMTNSAARRLVFINPDAHSISSLMSLDFINEEPEGVGVTDGKILIGFRGDVMIYQLEIM